MSGWKAIGLFVGLGFVLCPFLVRAEQVKKRTKPANKTVWNAKTLATLAKKHGRFPKVKGTTLGKTKRNLPAALPGRINLVLIAFARNHQKSIQSWLPTVKKHCKTHAGLDYMTIPVMNGFARLFSGLIEGGMRKTYKSRNAQIRTMPLYYGRSSFQKSLRLKGTGKLVLVLADQTGRVFWKATGKYNTTTSQSLQNTLQSLTSP